MSILLADIDATCAALGYSDGQHYQAEPDAVQGLKHLIWILRRDLDNHEYRRHLGHAKVLQTDLVYMLPDYIHDEEFADVLIRLLVILTNPTLLLYRDGPPKDNHGRKVFLELIDILQGYKSAFIREQIWTALFGKMQKSLEIDWALRSEEQSLLIERILVLIRNVLQVPANSEAECRADNDASVHDQVIWALHQSGILDLVLFIVSSPDENQFHLHGLEILCLLYREQTAESLADASLQRSVAEKQRDEQELIAVRRREKQRLLSKPPPGRHSRFGGTYVIRNFKSVSDRDIICHQPLERVAAIDFDREKQQQKRSFRHIKEEAQVTRRSAFSVRLCLREYCIEVLRSAYNTLIRQVRRVLERNSGSSNHDDSYLLWAIRFFMEFNRLSGLQLQLVSESLSVQCFHWVLTRMQHDMDMIVSDKGQARLWAKRLHIAIQTFRELLHSMLALQKLQDENALALFDMLLNNVCYVLEYRETILHLLMNYNEAHSTKAFLRDVIETANIFIKMMEKFCKDTVVVQDKKRGKKRSAGSKKATAEKQVTEEERREELENKWAEYAGTLSSLLSNELELPEEDQPIPFDVTAEKSIDDQKDDCMKRINKFLREEELEKAVALLRAAREVWPENDIFGAITAAPEDELLLLREIFLHNITAANLQCGQSSKLKRTIIHNPTQLAMDDCLYVIEPYSSNVCQLLVEFESFELQQPLLVDSTLECMDYLEIGDYLLCGSNSQQHLYLPFNVASGIRNIPINFQIPSRWSQSNWRLVVTQLECPAVKKRINLSFLPFVTDNSLQDARTVFSTHNSDWVQLAPPGCNQYFRQSSGTIKSFNYNENIATLYMPNLNYVICIKPTPGATMIEYTVRKFSLGIENSGASGFDTDCHSVVSTTGRLEDYLMIPQSVYPFMGVNTRPTYYCGTAIKERSVVTVETTNEAAAGSDDESENEEYEESENNMMVEKTFKFEDFAKRLLNPKIVRACTIVLTEWDHIPAKPLKAAVTILHRIAYGCSCPAMLYQAKLFLIFQQVFNAPRDVHHEELRRLGVYVIKKFVETAPNNPKIYAELLFYKTIKEANELETGYCDVYDSGTKGAWSEEQENELRLLFEENQRNPATDKDVIDWILENLIDKKRTRRGVLKKLKELGLMFKAPTKKSSAAVAGGKNLWQPEEDEELRSLYDMHRLEKDCLQKIMQEFFERRSKQQIIKRMLQLHIIADKSEIMPSKPRKHKSKKAHPNENDSNQSEDEFMEEPQFGEFSGQNSNHSVVVSRNKPKKVTKPKKSQKSVNRKIIHTALDVGTIRSLLNQIDSEKFQEAIDWLKEALEEAAEDEEAPAEEDDGVPLLPLTAIQKEAMEDADFKKLLISLSIQPPIMGIENYWRIPIYLNAADLKIRARILGGEELEIDADGIGEEEDDNDYDEEVGSEDDTEVEKAVSSKVNNTDDEEDALDNFARQRKHLDALVFTKSDEEAENREPLIMKGKQKKKEKKVKKKKLKELNSEDDEAEVNAIKRKLDKKKRKPDLSSDESDNDDNSIGEKELIDKKITQPPNNADTLFEQLKNQRAKKKNSNEKQKLEKFSEASNDVDNDLLNFNSEDYRKRLLELGDSDDEEQIESEPIRINENKENTTNKSTNRIRRINIIDSESDEEEVSMIGGENETITAIDNNVDLMMGKFKSVKDDYNVVDDNNDDVDKTNNQFKHRDEQQACNKRQNSTNMAVNDNADNKNGDEEGAIQVAASDGDAVFIKRKKSMAQLDDDNDDDDDNLDHEHASKNKSIKRRRLAIVDDDDDNDNANGEYFLHFTISNLYNHHYRHHLNCSIYRLVI